MQEFWFLNIDNPNKDSIEFEYLPLFYEQLMSHSTWAGLPSSWWKNYETFTKADYREFISLLGDPLDEEKLKSLPEDKQFFHQHDECIGYADRLLNYFEENKKNLEEEYRDDLKMFENLGDDDLRDPRNMKNIISDLTRLKKELGKAKEKQQGFWLRIMIDY